MVILFASSWIPRPSSVSGVAGNTEPYADELLSIVGDLALSIFDETVGELERYGLFDHQVSGALCPQERAPHRPSQVR